METTEERPRRPFHETVVDAIHRASNSDLESLATLIKVTNIPKNHDAIIEAWNQRRQEMAWGNEDLSVPADLLAQKREAEEKEVKKQAAAVTA